MIAVHWFRRDLRLEDNTALNAALSGDLPVLPVFIFDPNILEELPKDDARVSFIYQQLHKIHVELKKHGSGLLILQGDPMEVWSELIRSYQVKEVYFNRDYEPYARNRDDKLKVLLELRNIGLNTYKDQVIFEKEEVLKHDGKPYTVFTPYKRKWLKRFAAQPCRPTGTANLDALYKVGLELPSLDAIGFIESPVKVRDYNLSDLHDYAAMRNIPSKDGTSHLSPHLRFGTVSICHLASQFHPENEVFTSELIWREFFMQILYFFPKVVKENFRAKYNGIRWRNNEAEFDLWCRGRTGYPLVDAGMRQLNATGYMHNRVRMVTAGFLCKHLLIDWRWGEGYFARKLLDYELSSNNGNWQWAAGTGCDAAPYFRIFNPTEQLHKFDPDLEYVTKWVPEYGTADYPAEIVEHKFVRKRALDTYKEALKRYESRI